MKRWIVICLAAMTVASWGQEVLPDSDVVTFAKNYLGAKYHYGADGSNGLFDCSGFVGYVYRLVGVELPHSSGAQYHCGEHVEGIDSLQVGDLVFFKGRWSGSVGHVGIFIEWDSVGDAFSFIHASTSAGVCISHSDEAYYKKRYVGARRILKI
ncbi:MAG: C40 family peptidase [Paludibacteraceae bacterium]|nr:C40 family peptidase [Paludibacteraceae bacterium]